MAVRSRCGGSRGVENSRIPRVCFCACQLTDRFPASVGEGEAR